MVSSEFKLAVAKKNLLRTRIMLKDSLIVDPTFVCFDEMVKYAKKDLPDLMVPYDGGYLEDDCSEWTLETMNEELVQLVTNFSSMRINHLKKVVSRILKKETVSTKRKSDLKMAKQKAALKRIGKEARKVNKILYEVKEKQDRWNSENVDNMEQAAKAILKAVREYRASL